MEYAASNLRVIRMRIDIRAAVHIHAIELVLVCRMLLEMSI